MTKGPSVFKGVVVGDSAFTKSFTPKPAAPTPTAPASRPNPGTSYQPPSSAPSQNTAPPPPPSKNN